MKSHHILIVDDEEAITTAQKVLFQSAGYETAVAHSAQDAWQYLSLKKPDLLVLDVMMPEIDGYEVCQRVRQQPEYIPILMLTAKDESWEKVMGLELGADAYMTKPFEPGELLAQAKALLRLATQKNAPATEERPLTCGTLALWEQQCRVCVNEQEINLSPQEFKLLHFFLKHPEQVFGRETLLYQVWGYSYSGDTRTVDVHVQRLREKIAPIQAIQTVRGFGYRLVKPQ
ncbi:MAG: DNA-binding response regulator [Chloroflexota bacterium]|nr:response regulator transcription factor [Ardenticatenaceae bacterium]GIK57577.1 MAG: DNA-binding response regulator [Chloroflexota bacterium]